jgi:hypothetical protein
VLEELREDAPHLLDVLSQIEQSGDLLGLSARRPLVQVVEIQEAPVGEILDRREVPSVRGVVGNVELVVVHQLDLSR